MTYSRRVLILLILSSALALLPFAAMAAITVYPSGASFLTIQAAIDAADAGSTVLIPEGSYQGNLYITKPLTIIGYGFISFTPRDLAEPAVLIADTEDVALIDFHVVGASIGIQATNSSFRMSSCLIDEVETGVKITSMEGHVASLQECMFSSSGFGIGLELIGSGQLEMTYCDFFGFGTGAMLAGLTEATVYGCSFNECFDGMVVSETVHASLISNMIADADHAGIRIAEVPFADVPPGSIVLVDNEIETYPASPISMCGMSRSGPFAYAGVLQGFGNTIDCDPSALCSDNFEWPEGLFVVNGG